MINRLGLFHFIVLAPPPQGPAEIVAMESAPGVDGHAYWLLGEKGEPVPVRTIVDVLPGPGQTGNGVAMVLFREYQQTIGQRLEMEYAGLTITDWKYQVVAVRLIDIRPTIRSVGGTAGSGVGGALLLAEWLLVPETVVAEAEA